MGRTGGTRGGNSVQPARTSASAGASIGGGNKYAGVGSVEAGNNAVLRDIDLSYTPHGVGEDPDVETKAYKATLLSEISDGFAFKNVGVQGFENYEWMSDEKNGRTEIYVRKKNGPKGTSAYGAIHVGTIDSVKRGDPSFGYQKSVNIRWNKKPDERREMPALREKASQVIAQRVKKHKAGWDDNEWWYR